MFQPISFCIGLRYSRSRSRTGFVSFITFFSIVGILLGVTSLITVVYVMNGFEGELKKRILGLVPHAIVTLDKEKAANWRKQREQLLAFEHVLQVTPYVESEAIVASESTLHGVLLQGVEPAFETENIVTSSMTIGSLDVLNEQPYSVVIGNALARKLNVRIGEQIRLVLPGTTIFTPMGRIPAQRNFTVAGIFNVGSQVDDGLVYAHVDYVSKLMRKRGDAISDLRVFLNDAFYAKEFANLVKDSQPELSISTWSQSQGTLFSAVRMEKNMMWLMLSLIIAVAAFNIVSALVMVVIDKQGEIGILQTLGMTRDQIMKIFISQGMINGLWGATIGTVLGVALALNLNEITSALGVSILGDGYITQTLPVLLKSQDVIIIFVSAIFMSFISTLYPAYRASTTLPAEVLRNE